MISTTLHRIFDFFGTSTHLLDDPRLWSSRAAGTAVVRPARRAAAATQRATAAPSASTRTGRSTTTCAVRPSRPSSSSSSRPASSKGGVAPGLRLRPLSAPPPAPLAAVPGARRPPRPPRLSQPCARSLRAHFWPRPWTERRANRGGRTPRRRTDSAKKKKK